MGWCSCDGVSVLGLWCSWAWLRRRRLSAMSNSSLLVSRERWCGCVGVGASEVPPVPETCAMRRVPRYLWSWFQREECGQSPQWRAVMPKNCATRFRRTASCSCSVYPGRTLTSARSDTRRNQVGLKAGANVSWCDARVPGSWYTVLVRCGTLTDNEQI